MTLVVREATDVDFPVLAGIWNELHPNHVTSVENFAREVREARENPLGLHWAYWVAEQAGEIVGYASVEQYGGMFHADRYHAGVFVRPDARAQGVGSALAGTLADHLRARGAREVLAGYYETDRATPVLLAQYGLEELQRYFDAHLDLTTFDFTAWESALTVPDGVRVVSYADLIRERGPEEALGVYHDLFTATVCDVPAPGERTMPTLDAFRKRLAQEHVRLEGTLLAFAPDGQAVAFTELWAAEDDDRHAKIAFTCTRREWRGRGLALALKLRAMRDAAGSGFTQVTTNAESGNAPMLRLNGRLGFGYDVAYVECRWGNV